MKLCAFVHDTSEELRLGLVRESVVVDLHAAHVTSLSGMPERRASEIAWNLVPPDLLLFLRNGRFGWSALTLALSRLGPALDSVHLESPAGDKVAHPLETATPLPLIPAVTPGSDGWATTPLSLPWTADEEPVKWHHSAPAPAQVEIAAVISRPARDVTEDSAWEYVAGWIAADERSILRTPDELHPSADADLYCDVAVAVAEASLHHELRPGDVVNVTASSRMVIDVRETVVAGVHA